MEDRAKVRFAPHVGSGILALTNDSLCTEQGRFLPHRKTGRRRKKKRQKRNSSRECLPRDRLGRDASRVQAVAQWDASS